jgi:hypothetical protein
MKNGLHDAVELTKKAARWYDYQRAAKPYSRSRN